MSGPAFLTFLVGEEKNFELEYRIFNFYCVLGIIISLIMAVIRYYTNLPPIIGILLNAFILIAFGCWYLSRFQRFFQLAAFMAVFILIFVVTPVLWIFNSGSSGGAQYYFVFWGIMVCSVFHGWRRHFWLIMLFIVIGVLMYLEYYYPYLVVPYPTATARYIDVYASFATAMVATTSIFIIWTNSYRAEHNHVKEYAERLGKMAITDGLTNLYNHTYLYQRLEDEIYKAKRYHHKLSLIMVDIDFFKAFNDTYGHPIGDIILEQFAALLRSNIRLSDIAGRYGGEEFLIICPETDLEGALAITEKLRMLVEKARFGEDKSIVMTISCGVTYWSGGNSRQTIEMADQALYAAKKAGRNRVEIIKPEMNKR